MEQFLVAIAFRVYGIVSDLLELSRLQSGKITIHKEQIHIPGLLSDTVKSMQTIADKKEIQIECISADNVPQSSVIMTG